MAKKKRKPKIQKQDLMIEEEIVEREPTGDEIVQEMIERNPEVKKYYTKKYKPSKNPKTGEVTLTEVPLKDDKKKSVTKVKTVPTTEEKKEEMIKKENRFEIEKNQKEESVVEVKTDSVAKVKKEETIDKKKVSSTEKKPEPKNKDTPKRRFSVSNLLLMISFLVALIYFVCQLVRSSSIIALLNSMIITIFAVIYLIVCISYRTKKKNLIILSSLLLICYFCINIFNPSSVTTVRGEVIDFSSGTLKDAVVWSNKNKIDLIQEYEYSDLVPEYEIIRQSVKPGTKMKNVTEITVSISEGPNPYKEIVLPSMITWDSERVINYIKTNYLTNVIVEFVESDKLKNSVIEQSRSGSMLRNEEVKLTFSYGEEGIPSEVILIDFTNKSRFEIEFFMKQNHLTYNFLEDFSDKVKKGYGVKQSIAPGEKINTVDQKIDVTISKGPKIKIPDFHKMSVDEIMTWAIQNKLKIEFYDKYDDSVKEGDIISLDKETGDVVEQGAHIKVTLSRGSLVMPKFKNAEEFYTWADKYGIVYEVKHDFSDSVPAGEVIEYSHKKGDVIKNGEALSITISDGVKSVVPNVIGLTRNQAAAKLKNAGFNYNFVYRNSTTTKNQVLAQSISSGSEVSSGTTITVTLSNGTSNSNSGSGSNQHTDPTPPPTPEPPQASCENVTVYIDGSHIKSNPSATCSTIMSAYPSLKFSCSYVQDGGLANGMLENASSVDEHTFSTCDTVSLVIVNNN